MSRITTLYLILAIGVIFLTSCSGGSGNPVTPDLKDQAATEDVKGTKVVGGVWHIDIDEATGEFDIVNLRHSQLILNVLGFMEPPVLSGVSIDLASLVIEPPVIEVDVILSHPIPDTVFTGFDVRGVVFGPEVTNNDGLTILTGPEFFKGEPFGYIDGLLGAPDSYANYEGLAGYKYFCDGLSANDDLVDFMSNPANLANRGSFGPAPNSRKRHYELDWANSTEDFTIFNYAMYVNYDWPTSSGPPSGLDDFDINKANSAEAFCCNATEVANNLWYSEGSGGGSISLELEIWDWQGDIADVTIESAGAGIGETSYTADMGQGSTDYSYIYSFDEIPGTPTASGEHNVLITVTDTKTFGGYWFWDLLTPSNQMYNEQIYNCFIFTTTVIDAPPVEVNSIFPDTGETSTYLVDVLITGDYFSGPGAQVKLKMDAEPDIEAENVEVMDITTIQCDIFLPSDATPGLYDVEVTTGEGIIGVGEELFEVYEILPIIYSVEPATGETSTYMDDITITGENFEGPNVQVEFTMDMEPSIVATDVIVMSPTTVTCDIFIPYGTFDGLYDIEVTNNDGKSGVGEQLFEIIDLSPIIVSIDPAMGETGEDLFGVSVLGANFEGPGTQVKLKMESEVDIVADNVIVVNAFSISCDLSVPEHAEIGFYSVEVTNGDGKYGTSEDLFEVFTTNPIVSIILPNSGQPEEILTEVSIFGQNFEGPGAQVNLKMELEPDIVATNVVVVDASQIMCDISIPLGSALGLYDVEVINGSGKSGIGEELFEVYLLIPEVIGIVPEEADAGTNLVDVTVIGLDFQGPGAEVKLVMASEPEIDATNVVVDNTTAIFCDISIPLDATPGVYDVVVTNGNGQSGKGELLFAVLGPPPVVTSIDPNTSEAGAELTGVTVYGDYFVGPNPVIRLIMESEPPIAALNVVVVDVHTITCDINIPPDAALGFYDVNLINGDGKLGTGENLFEVTCPTPVIEVIEPDFGLQDAVHVQVSITGSNFVGPEEDADVRLTMTGQSDIVCLILSYESELINVVLDLTGAALGAWDVEVTNGCGGFASAPAAFTVQE